MLRYLARFLKKKNDLLLGLLSQNCGRKKPFVYCIFIAPSAGGLNYVVGLDGKGNKTNM